MSWFERKRMEWIHESVRIYGFINAKHIMKKFGVSAPQASNDLGKAMKLHPNLMKYDLSKKCYVESTSQP